MSATRLRVDGLKLGFSNGRHALFAEHNACFVSDAIVCPLFMYGRAKKSPDTCGRGLNYL